jgi:hypothetical protein
MNGVIPVKNSKGKKKITIVSLKNIFFLKKGKKNIG